MLHRYMQACRDISSTALKEFAVPLASKSTCLDSVHVFLAHFVLLRFLATVEGGPLRLVLEQSHRLKVLHVKDTISKLPSPFGQFADPLNVKRPLTYIGLIQGEAVIDARW